MLLGFHFFFEFESILFGKIAGYVGIVAGLSGMYEVAAIILNEKYSKQILPLE